jgi:TatD DNase family protein
MAEKVFDSHCHLTDPRLLGSIDAVMQRARQAGVAGVLTVGTGIDDGRAAIGLAERFGDVWAAAGIHPHNAGTFRGEMLADLAAMLGHPRMVALGEIGLDYHYDFAPRDAQQAAFEAQLRLAADLGKPVIIHSRLAIDDALAIIARVRLERGNAGGPICGVFHSFTGTVAEAGAILEAGFFISLSGVVTFKKAAELADVARAVPADRLLLETDGPYLSPEPMRKIKANEPALLVHTLARVAELRGVSIDELAGQTTRNVAALFNVKSACIDSAGPPG